MAADPRDTRQSLVAQGTVVPSSLAPGTVPAAFMTMSAVAWAARWAASGRTLV
jgi:hypothetical protein